MEKSGQDILLYFVIMKNKKNMVNIKKNKKFGIKNDTRANMFIWKLVKIQWTQWFTQK